MDYKQVFNCSICSEVTLISSMQAKSERFKVVQVILL